MHTTTHRTLPNRSRTFDPDRILDPEVLLDPMPFYTAMRTHDPVHWNPATRSWYLTRYHDVERLLRNDHLGARDKSAALAAMTAEEQAAFAPVERFLRKWLVFSDPPYQSAVRRHVQRVFTPHAVSAHGAALEDAAYRRTAVLGSTGADLLRDVVRPYTLDVICRFLGIREDERATVLGWSDQVMTYLSTAELDIPAALATGAAIDALTTYVTDSVLPREEGPVAALLHGLHQDGRLAADEVTATFTQILTGGVDPVANAAVHGLVMLAEAPRQRAVLDDGEAGCTAAVEETLRLSAPFHFAPRTALDSVELGHGRTAAPGERVVLVLAAANRDPAVFDHPDAFDVGRRGPRHLSFGRGGHFCLGSVLARQSMAALFRAFHASCPDAGPGTLRPVRRAAFGSTSFDAVPLFV
ncbi:hypothetical protein AQI88_16610 [Streptomyces cellostaticus]|uniref:Cytochrome n=1 Tax=Streptomyces cellostaticus TaxID=67285 RepID=A0A101NMF1_9ACTN|nr:cytochrome P450 [Streptomyces cellostaticus]KUM95682.1 hypothetical protein AQI88_16610 [Streptomyces cellostaticus]GHI09719.1 cytochrome P-450 like protein [Streptomyces cellostaticus]